MFRDFGDNFTSTSSNPNHTYLSPGSYQVKLFSFNGNCTDSIIKPISIISTGINGINNPQNNIIVSPNPASNSLSLNAESYSGILTYKIFNFSGKEVQTGTINNSTKQIIITPLPTGLYFLQLFLDHKFIGNQKFIKNNNLH